MQIVIRFYECEHEGDVSRYAEGVITAGGSVVSESFDEESGSGRVVAEVDSLEAFKKRLHDTGGDDFVSGMWVKK